MARLPELFELWEAYREAEGPVGQAVALGEFANAMAHLRWDFTGELEDDGE